MKQHSRPSRSRTPIRSLLPTNTYPDSSYSVPSVQQKEFLEIIDFTWLLEHHNLDNNKIIFIQTLNDEMNKLDLYKHIKEITLEKMKCLITSLCSKQLNQGGRSCKPPLAIALSHYFDKSSNNPSVFITDHAGVSFGGLKVPSLEEITKLGDKFRLNDPDDAHYAVFTRSFTIYKESLYEDNSLIRLASEALKIEDLERIRSAMKQNLELMNQFVRKVCRYFREDIMIPYHRKKSEIIRFDYKDVDAMMERITFPQTVNAICNYLKLRRSESFDELKIKINKDDLLIQRCTKNKIALMKLEQHPEIGKLHPSMVAYFLNLSRMYDYRCKGESNLSVETDNNDSLETIETSIVDNNQNEDPYKDQENFNQIKQKQSITRKGELLLLKTATETKTEFSGKRSKRAKNMFKVYKGMTSDDFEDIYSQ